MKWTTRTPTRPGLYYCRPAPHNRYAHPVKFYKAPSGLLMIESTAAPYEDQPAYCITKRQFEWAGPLPNPPED